MEQHDAFDQSAPSSVQPSTTLDALRDSILRAAYLLPAQGPITAFVHHNTLHAFEDLPFDDAVDKGRQWFGCHPYLPEDDYRRLFASQRIRTEDLQAVLLDDLGEHADSLIGRLGTQYHLRLAMLEHPLQVAPPAELRWLVAETDALRRFRACTPDGVRKRTLQKTKHWVMRDLRDGDLNEIDDELRSTVERLFHRFPKSNIESWSERTWEAFCLHLLWRVCYRGVCDLNEAAPSAAETVRHRDVLLNAGAKDSDKLVHPLLIRFCAAFLDQGFADWPLPGRQDGLYQAFLSIYRHRGGPPDRWLHGLRDELQRLSSARKSPLESVEESFDVLGVSLGEREPYVTQTLLALRGFAGMIWQLETRGDRVPHPVRSGSLVDYLAVRLILERLALAHVARQSLGYRGPLRNLRDTLAAPSQRFRGYRAEERAFLIFQLAQSVAWTPQELSAQTPAEWAQLVRAIERFSSTHRRRVYHHAYERRYRIEALDAVAAHADRAAPADRAPRYHVICCIDEREESFRRHLEEIAPDCETLGAAGFYGVAMYYRGAADAHFQPLCPAMIRPQHYVREEVVYPFQQAHHRRARTRRVLGTASHRLHLGSRTFAGGAFLTTLLGPLASIPMVMRVLLPRLTSQFRRALGRLVQTPPVTKLQLERTASQPGPDHGHVGFTLSEMAEIVLTLLMDMGLTKNFSPLIIVMGHGSSSLNNPHEAAHDCGACGGARGGPNARAFAQMANDSRVRALVAKKGLEIPAEVRFLGGYHNTCDDSVVYFDLDELPNSHNAIFERANRDIHMARQRNAHERCRRFETAPLKLTVDAALRHVEGRAEDLAQTRPEYGHATNALCFVGRRWKTYGLFLDRRAFLTSYDPEQDDDECSILTRILSAVIPVCAGINLEYYFSLVDSTGYGCGTKLPHNVTSLLGVMDGAASDLRPGLPWQMVEIHEPVRLLFVIETTPQTMLAIMDGNEAIGKLCRNHWVQIATQDPATSDLHLFRHGAFQPYRPASDDLPRTQSSVNWYRGWRDHLGFASVACRATAQSVRLSPAREGSL